jgi:NAD-dependent deacetylase
VVWFGEVLPESELTQAAVAAASADLLLVVGTSGLVYPAAAVPHAALAEGVPICVIDPADVPLAAHPGVRALRSPAGECLPALVAAAWPDP